MAKKRRVYQPRVFDGILEIIGTAVMRNFEDVDLDCALAVGLEQLGLLQAFENLVAACVPGEQHPLLAGFGEDDEAGEVRH